MSVSFSRIFEQGPALRALAGVAFAGLHAPNPSKSPASPLVAPVVPGDWVEAVLPPRSPALIRDFVRHVGGDANLYRRTLPPHLVSQWAFAVAAKTLKTVPYPLSKALNAGCKIEVIAPIPSDQPIVVKARLESMDVREDRVILVQRVVTGTREIPDALIADFRVYIPLGSKNKGQSRTPITVPLDVQELSFRSIAADAGLDFAKLTGDFNPIHWIAPVARAAGFRSPILHGFSTFARAFEALTKGVFAGEPRKLRLLDVSFRKPLPLPARVGFYVDRAAEQVFVGDAPGGNCYLEGSYRS